MPRAKPDSRLMIEASAKGSEGIRQAHTQDVQLQLAQLQQSQQLGQTVGGAIGQIEQGRRMDREEQFRDRQQSERERSNRFGEALEEEKLDITMADKGLERTGPSRLDRLREEMSRGSSQSQQLQVQPEGSESVQPGQMPFPTDPEAEQRGFDQGQQPIEIAGPDRPAIGRTAERMEKEGSELTTRRMNAQAALINATVNMQEAKAKYQKAKISGDPEEMRRSMKTIENQIKSSAKLFNDGRSGRPSEQTKDSISALVGDNPDPELQKELQQFEKTDIMGRRLGGFVQNKVNELALQYISVDGDMPDGSLVDFSSPLMRQFSEFMPFIKSQLMMGDTSTGGQFSRMLGINSLEARNRVVRRLTARTLLNSLEKPTVTPQSAMGGGQAMGGPTGDSIGAGIIPSQGGTMPQPAGQQQRQPDTRERRGPNTGAGSSVYRPFGGSGSR